MLGLILKGVQQFVESECSEVAKQVLKSKLGNELINDIKDYDDATVVAILDELANAEGISLDELLRRLGRFLLLEYLKPKYPALFVKPSAKHFLLDMDVVHNSAKKMASSAKPPKLEFEDPAPDKLVIKYFSSRKLCSLLTGLVEGVGEAFGEKLDIVETQCSRKGAAYCRFELTFHK